MQQHYAQASTSSSAAGEDSIINMKRGSDLSDTVMCDAQDVDQQQQQQQDQDDDIGNPKEAQYLSANCVLFMSYTGDAASVVDEHFSRALHQQQQQDFNSESSVVASTSTSVDVAKGSVIIKGTSCHHTTHYLLLPPPAHAKRARAVLYSRVVQCNVVSRHSPPCLPPSSSFSSSLSSQSVISIKRTTHTSVSFSRPRRS